MNPQPTPPPAEQASTLQAQIDTLAGALRQIESEDYEPMGESFTAAAAEIARAALSAAQPSEPILLTEAELRHSPAQEPSK